VLQALAFALLLYWPASHAAQLRLLVALPELLT
jgi:hypothetical protein